MKISQPPNYARFLELYGTATNIIQNAKERLQEHHWETVFEIMFKTLKPEIDATGVEIDWVDPDTSYREDVMAYFEALKEKAEEIGPVIADLNSQHNYNQDQDS